MTKIFFAILLTIFICISSTAQEILTAPAFNPIVAKQHNLKLKLKNTAAQQSGALTLPFYDDFSVISVFPSPLRWTDSMAFVNTDYAKYPLTIGVATLDAINAEGALYPGASKYSFDADYLTSLPIRLDSVFSPEKKAISRADSLYLSFYYQPQGRAVSPPAKNASLILEFHSPGDSVTTITGTDTSTVAKWTQVWSTDGGVQVDTFALPDNQYFRQVLIPITRYNDSVLYYKNGFQFRFRNIASLFGNNLADWRSNGSNWNIDIVYLHTDGSVYDTAYPDVAFGNTAPSMLRNYESMPFRQYRNNFINEMKDTLAISIGNLDNKLQNRIYKYYINKDSENPAYDGGTHTIKSFHTYGYTEYKPWATPPVNYFFPTLPAEKVVFHITHVLSPDPEPLFQSNDTTRFDQLFSNYYAYDNGTAEAGIGINNAPGSYAVQFKLNIADTLRGIQIYFNQVLGGTNEVPLDLVVWNDDLGKPGQIVKSIRGVIPEYTNLNEFTTYWFDTPQTVNAGVFPGLYFYIGWTQAVPYNMNVGFDRCTDSHSKRYFNVSGAWEKSDSINYGSLLMRPVVGSANPLGILKPAAAEQLTIQPNPVTDGNLVIRLPESWKQNAESNLKIDIISATGSRVLSQPFSTPVNVGRLAPGFYIVTLTETDTGQRATAKLIIR